MTPEQRQRLKQIREEVAEANAAGTSSAYFLEYQDVGFLLELLAEVERERDNVLANQRMMQLALKENAEEKEQREVDVRALCESVERAQNDRDVPAAAFEDQLAPIREWLKGGE